MDIIKIAQICHEANRLYCDLTGDHSQVGWKTAPTWQRESAISGVKGILDGGITTPQQAHEHWLADKKAEGWVYGVEKDAQRKTHPALVNYDALAEQQKKKDALFFAIVNALK